MKLKFALVCTVLFTALSLFRLTAAVSAAEEILPSVSKNASVELSQTEVIFPQPKADGWSYTIELYALTEDGAEELLSSGGYSYAFSAVGNYRLKYKMEKGADSRVLECALAIVDTTGPDIRFKNRVEIAYAAGKKADISYTAYDLGGACSSDIKIYVNGKENKGVLKGNILTLKETGEYKIVIEASDPSGNKSYLTHLINAGEGTAKNNMWIYFVAGGGVLLLAAVVTVILILRRKKHG